ncbi:Uncharacterized protein dnm_056830 [Desulfonema magnum]|uniref:Uncharacterized protein n=1 Tax=Desulfonema magnum TaxID=45655 RepID=A0A975BQI1_9BACT|nr:Uncharacterized protein dnm_056830 [Desulfonema magnum]
MQTSPFIKISELALTGKICQNPQAGWKNFCKPAREHRKSRYIY